MVEDIMTQQFGFLLNFVIEHYGTDHIFWIFYIINFIFSVIAYKLGFARELPLLKSVIVYILLFIGTYITTIFTIFYLPITESLIIISIVLAIYRFRMYRQRRKVNNA